MLCFSPRTSFSMGIVVRSFFTRRGQVLFGTFVMLTWLRKDLLQLPGPWLTGLYSPYPSTEGRKCPLLDTILCCKNIPYCGSNHTLAAVFYGNYQHAEVVKVHISESRKVHPDFLSRQVSTLCSFVITLTYVVTQNQFGNNTVYTWPAMLWNRVIQELFYKTFLSYN